jgi:hypothetical protein
MMRYLVGALGAFVLMLTMVVGILVASPCLTHNLYIANETETAAAFKISLGDKLVWEGGIERRKRRRISIVSAIGESGWNIEATTNTNPPRHATIKNAYYLVGHPHETHIYIMVLTQEGIEFFPIEHPLISTFESETWQHLASVALTAVNFLSCLDRSRARRRLVR